MRGRPPKPTFLKVITGNPGKRRLNPAEAVTPPGMPQPPTHLLPEALTEWRRVAPLLYRSGLLSRLDRAALAAYCQSYGRWQQAERVLANTGFTISTPAGYLTPHPAVGIARRAMTDAMRYAAELGMTPSARSRVTAVPPPRPRGTDPADEYFR